MNGGRIRAMNERVKMTSGVKTGIKSSLLTYFLFRPNPVGWVSGQEGRA